MEPLEGHVQLVDVPGWWVVGWTRVFLLSQLLQGIYPIKTQ